ncbi:type II toxin-antitoxin system HipA family toxin [Gulosibacter molinativorax]|nr:HipA domain-containing protein [Gulosibacter molinativorax]
MTFQYADSYLAETLAYELSPDLPLDRSIHVPAIHLNTFHAFRDVQPDRWGQRLIESAERRDARAAGRAPRRLTDLDILLRIPDETRQGALRFLKEGEPAPPSADIAPVERLPWVAAVTGRIETDDALDEQALRLLPTGTGAGGARPKFTVRLPSGRLALAKLPSRSDRWDVARWEVATARAAVEAGIRVPEINYVPGHEGSDGITVIDRFDRGIDGRRIGYRSGAGLLELTDATDYSYADLASAALAVSTRQDELGAELFRRVAFTVLVNNVDDHARNHGFLRTESDWEISPAFDVNPHPAPLEATPIDRDDDPTNRDLRRLIADRDRYGVSLDLARESIALAIEAAASVPGNARELGATDRELDYFADIFDEVRFEDARALIGPPGAVDPRATGKSRARDALGRFTPSE